MEGMEEISKVVVSLLPYLGVVVGVVTGAIFTHLFSVKRDLVVKRREVILDNLILAYEGLLQSSTIRPDGNLKNLEDVINRIQLVGDEKLIDLADKSVRSLTGSGKSNLTPLFIELRDKIRVELNLHQLPKKYFGLVIKVPGDRGYSASKFEAQEEAFSANRNLEQ